MKRYIQSIMDTTEREALKFVRRQVLNKEDVEYGGLHGRLVDIKPTVYAIQPVITLYLNQESNYYRNEDFSNAITRALGFIKKGLRPEGMVDYPMCNFSSAPDTAFCLYPLIPAYRLFLQFGDYVQDKIIIEELKSIVKTMLTGMLEGGFHTPNHRWAIVGTMMQGYDLFKDDPIHNRFKEMADLYLQEGIDGNEDGEYAERSAGGYNGVVNEALIMLYEATDDESYLDYVKRNLHMMLNYFEPDGTIFTENSTRQDKGQKAYGDFYFYQYLYIAEHYQDSILSQAAHKLIQETIKRQNPTPLCLNVLMLNPRLMTYDLEAAAMPTTYRRYFKESGVVRVRKDAFSYSILKSKKRFLFLQLGELQFFVRLSFSYCDVRSFVVQDVIENEDGYTLKFNAKGWYYLPFEEKQASSDWWQMDHSQRKLLIANEIAFTVNIKELPTGLQLDVDTEGRDQIPVRLEIAVPSGAMVDTESAYLRASEGESMILKNAYAKLDYESSSYKIGPGFAAHTHTGHYSGEENNGDYYTLIMTDYTPMKRTVYMTYEELF